MSKRRVLAYLSLLLLLTAFLTAGRFLTLTQPAKQTEVIVVLSGGSGRLEEAARLYKAGYAPYMILSNAKESASAAGDMFKNALALGIPQEAILTENEARSTYQNAEFTLPIMKEHGFTSAIVVSSDFHMRRVKILFDRVYKKSGIELTYIGSDSGYHARRWWGDRYSRETTFNEYVKMIGNAFGYNGPEAKDVLNQIKAWFR
ncbi:YdcF family protein [Paenibacillus agri]|uniref:YdcF family protein n=1 Tax=Paenibacillus agri TaxID=2744309 RepID=A0A850EEL0_9BACL|nr:YdcF family protein [Paenibacillus agri]NUU59615.1 YdcF family protein [Paenibacillus agri]